MGSRVFLFVSRRKRLKVLKGHALTESDYSDIEKQLKELFYQLIFKPIVDLLAPQNAQVKAAAKELKNSVLLNAKFDPIVTGINSGKIQYVDGTFSGDFNAAISRALKSYGAQWNRQTKTFAIQPEQLPAQVTDAVAGYAETAKQLHDALEARLKTIEMELTYKIQQNPIDAQKMIEKMDKKFQKQYGDALGVGDLSEEAKNKLARMYADSLKPYIKKFGSEEINDIRALVKANAETGYRFDSLVKRIENRYDVSKTKASFLARQETALYTSAARRQRFGDVGITSYIWRTAGDAEVRADHRKLNGRVFEYSRPPVVDEATGRRDNPGQDFNCRCVDEPVLPSVLAAT